MILQANGRRRPCSVMARAARSASMTHVSGVGALDALARRVERAAEAVVLTAGGTRIDVMAVDA